MYKKLIFIYVITTMIFLYTGCSSGSFTPKTEYENIKFEVLIKEGHNPGAIKSKTKEPYYAIINNEAELYNIFSKAQWAPELSGIDFSRDILVFASRGLHNYSGSRFVSVTKINKTNSNIVIEVATKDLSDHFAAFDYPFTLVKIRKDNLGLGENITFIFQNQKGEKLASVVKKGI